MTDIEFQNLDPIPLKDNVYIFNGTGELEKFDNQETNHILIKESLPKHKFISKYKDMIKPKKDS